MPQRFHSANILHSFILQQTISRHLYEIPVWLYEMNANQASFIIHLKVVLDCKKMWDKLCEVIVQFPPAQLHFYSFV